MTEQLQQYIIKAKSLMYCIKFQLKFKNDCTKDIDLFISIKNNIDILLLNSNINHNFIIIEINYLNEFLKYLKNINLIDDSINQINENQINENQNNNQINDNYENNNQINNNQINDNYENDNQINDNYENNNQINDNQINDNYENDNQINDNYENDNQINDNQINDNYENENENENEEINDNNQNFIYDKKTQELLDFQFAQQLSNELNNFNN